MTRTQALRAMAGSALAMLAAGRARAQGFRVPGVKMDWDMAQDCPNSLIVCLGSPVEGTVRFSMDLGEFQEFRFVYGDDEIRVSAGEMWKALGGQ